MALSGAAYAASLNKLSLMNLFATSNARNAPDDANYKALVAIFLFGGNDANNMLIPYDNYADYAAARAGSAFEIAQADLLQINSQMQGQVFGLPNRTTYNTMGMYNHYQDGNLAFVCNAGTLLTPLDKPTYLAHPELRPDQLFSHSNQQDENQSGIYQGSTQTGWGGRLAERVYGGELFPLQVSVAGVTIYSTAITQRPLVVSPAPTALNQALRYDPDTAQHPEILEAVNAILALDDGTVLRGAAAGMKSQSLSTRGQLLTDPVVGTFPNTALGNQLKQIAKFISLRDTLSGGGPMGRQVFFASLGGFDTHANQNAGQGGLLTQLSAALDAFYAELVRQDVVSQVTTFTMSDFARTFKIGAQASGTDHAWGSHHIVMGGSVFGGDCYGAYPNLALAGDDDADTGSNARGRWIPSTSTAQYGATLAKWFGVSDADMPYVFPNIGQFSQTDLGFMRNS